MEDNLSEADDGIPPSSRPPERPGFLSDRSIEYLTQMRRGEKSWDSELSGYAHLKRDVGGALADFNLLTGIDDLNLFLLAVEFTESADDLTKDPTELNYHQQRMLSAWLGLFTLPKLYDDAFDFEWNDELVTHITEVTETLTNEEPQID